MHSLRNAALVFVLVAVALLAYWPSAIALWSFWELNPYVGGDGPLVAAISLALIWRSRHALAATPLEPSRAGAAWLLVCSLLWVIFWRAAIQELHMLLLPLIFLLVVLAAFGRGAARICAFPLAYLYFAEPTWHVLIASMQGLTIRAVGVLAPVLGMPVRIAGNLLYLPPNITFEVTALCSGVNYLAVGLAVAALIGELQGASLRRRAALLAFMGVLSVASNWVRVLLIIAAGYTGGMDSWLVTRGHVLFGWAVFAVVMLAFAWAVRRDVTAEPVARGGLGSGEPWLRGGAIAVGLLLAPPLLAGVVPGPWSTKPATLALHLPAAASGWDGPLPAADPAWKPEFIGAHFEWRAAYRDSGSQLVELRAIGYASQEQSRKLVSDGNSLLGTGELTAVAVNWDGYQEPRHIEILASDPRGRRFVVWAIYDIDGRRFVNPLFSQLWYGLRSLAGAPYSVLFAYRTPCEPSCEAARSRLAAFERNVASGVAVRSTTSELP